MGSAGGSRSQPVSQKGSHHVVLMKLKELKLSRGAVQICGEIGIKEVG